ncbi:MAG: hypothetical protein LQ338_005310 [Usnochroma carphineum]|nr:MAG: hypothetical protein LQ338_005310 [Usnochroma carphineum]
MAYESACIDQITHQRILIGFIEDILPETEKRKQSESSYTSNKDTEDQSTKKLKFEAANRNQRHENATMCHDRAISGYWQEGKAGPQATIATRTPKKEKRFGSELSAPRVSGDIQQ